MKDSVEDWKKCVKKAKKIHGTKYKFVMIKGPLLKTAQLCYCAMGY